MSSENSYLQSKTEFLKGSRRISIKKLPKGLTKDEFENKILKNNYETESKHFETKNFDSCKLIMSTENEAKKIIGDLNGMSYSEMIDRFGLNKNDLETAYGVIFG